MVFREKSKRKIGAKRVLLFGLGWIGLVVFGAAQWEGDDTHIERATDSGSSLKDIKQTHWLIGTWARKTSRSVLYESWQKEADLSLSGKSYALRETAGAVGGGTSTEGNAAVIGGTVKVDTVVFETIRLLSDSGKLYYIPTVSNQNNGQPVRFVQKSLNDSLMVFENPAHDFPQIISYRKIGTDSLVAEISGKTVAGVERKQTFAMKRVK